MRLRRTAILVVLLPWALGLFSSPASAATITVTTEADEFLGGTDGDCSLREAVQAANTDDPFGGCPTGNGPDVIQLPTGTYTFTRSGNGEDLNSTGDLDITSDITIQGPAGGSATIDADDLDRVIHVVSGNLTVSNIRIENGNSLMYVLPPAIVIQGNGGGIHADGAATISVNDSVFIGNQAANLGGGIAGTAVTLTRTTFSGNQASSGGGLAKTGVTGTVSITSSIFDINSVTGNGGGIANIAGGQVSVVRTLLRDNEADLNGGGVYIQTDFGDGALTVSDSLIEGNDADDDLNGSGNGGGIYSTGLGMDSSDVTVAGVTLRDNLGADGDGLWVSQPGTISIRNSTISSQGTVANTGQGGGLFNASGTTTGMRNVTFADNAVSVSGNGAHVYNLGTVNVRNSVFGPDLNGGGCNSPLNEPGPNLEENGGAAPCVAGQTGDLRLDVLEDNGGPQLFDFVGAPKTHALEAGSPATGEGVGCENTDERGVPRPQGNGCDLGAYEVAMCFGRAADDPVGITGGQTARTGTSGADVLFGLGARETIRGLGGNDRLCGGGGRDRLLGGAGKDRMDGGPQRDTCAGGPGRDRARACERVTGVP